MKNIKKILLLVIFCSSFLQANGKKIVGYYENWAQYRTGYDGAYSCKPQDLDTSYIDKLTQDMLQ